MININWFENIPLPGTKWLCNQLITQPFSICACQ